jgi:hypothetical protein
MCLRASSVDHNWLKVSQPQPRAYYLQLTKNYAGHANINVLFYGTYTTKKGVVHTARQITDYILGARRPSGTRTMGPDLSQVWRCVAERVKRHLVKWSPWAANICVLMETMAVGERRGMARLKASQALITPCGCTRKLTKHYVISVTRRTGLKAVFVFEKMAPIIEKLQEILSPSRKRTKSQVPLSPAAEPSVTKLKVSGTPSPRLPTRSPKLPHPKSPKTPKLLGALSNLWGEVNVICSDLSLLLTRSLGVYA